MKKILYIALSLVLSLGAYAQVDRSVQPKPGPSPKINLGKPQSFQLANGLTVLVVENHKLPQVTFSLALDNPPALEGGIKGVNQLTSAIMGSGTSKISKAEFNEQIDYYGARTSFSVDRVGGSTLSRYFPQVFALVANGALDPLFTEEELKSERNKLLDGLKSEEKSAAAIADNVRSVLTYGKNHPDGEVLHAETIEKVTLADVKKYYAENFVPANAYLVVVGDVNFDEVKKLVTDHFSSWKKASAPTSSYTDPVNLATTEIDFVDVPNAVQSEISVSNVINLKMTDPDYFAALLANQILGGGGEGRLFLNLREANAWTYGSYSSLSGSKYVSDFMATASVRNAVTDSAIVEMMKELRKIRTTQPTQDELDLAKAKYIGNFVMNAEKPQTIARFALTSKTQSLPDDFYSKYIERVNAVTLGQVQAAAQKYILHADARIIVVGKASEVLPLLEKLPYQVNFFDKYGTPTTKPEQAVVSSDVTATTVLERYLDAIGGEAAIRNVKTMSQTAKATVQGNEIIVEQKTTADGRSLQEMKAMGMVMTKAAYNGKTGYAVVQGQRKEFDEKELKEMKYVAPFPELLLMSSDIKLNGIEDGSYVLTLDDKSYYYDVETGLKTGESVTKELAPGQPPVTQKVTYSDYRDVQGVKIPYKSTMNVGIDIELTTTDIKLNEAVLDSDFE